jgi:hypothetical protein
VYVHDICPGGTGFKKVAESIEKRIGVIAVQVIARIEPDSLATVNGIAG